MRSIVKMRVENFEIKGSADPVPLDDSVLEELLRWRAETPYAGDDSYVFASPKMKGKQSFLDEPYHATFHSAGGCGSRDPIIATGSMATGRNFHTATLLASGTVLVLGRKPSLFSTASGEFYDPNSEVFSTAGRLVTPREGHTATVLPNGKVLVTGGVEWISGPDSPQAIPLRVSRVFSFVRVTLALGKTAPLLSNISDHVRSGSVARELWYGQVKLQTIGPRAEAMTCERTKSVFQTNAHFFR